MVRLRLQRFGRKKRPYYHIVAADIRAPRDGRIIEDLGRYNPVSSPKMVTVETDRVVYWLQNGAQPTESVRNLLKAEGIYYRLHLMRWGKSAEEIEETISEWKENKSTSKKRLSKSEVKRAALKAEEARVAEAEAEAAELAKKEAEEAAKKLAEEEAKAAAEAEAEENASEDSEESTEEVATNEAPADEAEPAADDASEEQKG